MKFLVFTLCVCAVSAATFDFNPYKPIQQVQPVQQYQAYRRPVTTPVLAKNIYNTAKFVSAVPVVPVQKSYSSVLVSETPVIATRTAEVIEAAPVVTGKPVYDAVPVVTAAPIVAAKIYENTPIVKPVYGSAPVVTKTVLETAPVVAKSYSAINTKTVYNKDLEAQAQVLRYDANVDAEGFNYAYETDNGISAQSSGTLKTVDGANVVVTQGSYQYIAADGTPVQVSYIADENGFQPKSDLLPVAPPVPPQIARALEYIYAHPPKPEVY